jgi:hypothetical protein
VITAANNAGTYFGKDGRSITQDGVAHAMDLFFAHFAEEPRKQPASATHAAASQVPAHDADEPRIVCDEDDFYRALAASKPH